MEAVPDERERLHLVFPLQRGDPAHDRVRLPHHHGGVPRGHLRHVRPEHIRRADAGLHGGGRLREAVAAQETHPDVAVLAERRHMSEGRSAVPHVSGGRHEEEPHHRGARQGAAHQAQGDPGGRAPAVLSNGAEGNDAASLLLLFTSNYFRSFTCVFDIVLGRR